MTRRTATRLSLVLAIAALAGACAGGAASPSTPAGTATAPPASPSAQASGPATEQPSGSETPSATAGEATELEITAKEFAFEGPTSVPAGPVSIRLKNDGQEEHQAQVARIAEGSTFEDLVAALQSPDPSVLFAMVTLVGGPTGVAPGEEVVVSSVLEPGTHALLCFVASPDGIPHLAKGMVGQFEVTEGTAGGELPAGDAQLTLQDFAFVGLTSLPAGEQVVRLTNSGPQPHEATVVKLSEGVTVEDLFAMASASAPPSGPPPFTSAGGIAGLTPGLEATMTLDLEPGNYAFVCFVPDPASGKAHVELGMIGELTVQ